MYCDHLLVFGAGQLQQWPPWVCYAHGTYNANLQQLRKHNHVVGERGDQWPLSLFLFSLLVSLCYSNLVLVNVVIVKIQLSSCQAFFLLLQASNSYPQTEAASKAYCALEVLRIDLLFTTLKSQAWCTFTAHIQAGLVLQLVLIDLSAQASVMLYRIYRSTLETCKCKNPSFVLCT